MFPFIKKHFSAIRANTQFGFRNNSSTIANLIESTEIVYKNLNKFKECYSIYFDFAKAFDKINHNILFDKLKYYKFPIWSVNIIREFLNNRRQYVFVNNSKSLILNITSGVPQGTILGPLLFSIYINDLVNSKLNCYVSAFADDLKLIGHNASDLQLYINYITNWASKNEMPLNLSKFIAINYNSHLQNPSLYLCGNLIKFSECERDLGILFDNKLTFRDFIDKVRQKSLFLINCFFRIFRTKSIDDLKKLY